MPANRPAPCHEPTVDEPFAPAFAFVPAFAVSRPAAMGSCQSRFSPAPCPSLRLDPGSGLTLAACLRPRLRLRARLRRPLGSVRALRLAVFNRRDCLNYSLFQDADHFRQSCIGFICTPPQAHDKPPDPSLIRPALAGRLSSPTDKKVLILYLHSSPVLT